MSDQNAGRMGGTDSAIAVTCGMLIVMPDRSQKSGAGLTITGVLIVLAIIAVVLGLSVLLRWRAMQPRTPSIHDAVLLDLDDIDRHIAMGADVNALNSSGQTPLFVALAHNEWSAVPRLLHAGADANARDRRGRLPLIRVCRQWKQRFPPPRPIVATLLKAGADPNLRDHGVGLTAVHYAVMARDTALLDQLVDAGGDVNRPDLGGWTPMHRAAAHGYLVMVQHLIDKGAEVMAESHDGMTPIALANRGCHVEVVRALLDAATDPTAEGAIADPIESKAANSP